MRHGGHTSKVKEAIGDDGGANDSTRSLASPLLTPQGTKRGVDSVDSLGDDQYAEGGATAPEAKKTRRQEHVSEFEREVRGAQDRSATHNSANLPDYLDFGVRHT